MSKLEALYKIRSSALLDRVLFTHVRSLSLFALFTASYSFVWLWLFLFSFSVIMKHCTERKLQNIDTALKSL